MISLKSCPVRAAVSTAADSLTKKTLWWLSAVLDYLHHLSPYPILYQDLKPEHIILCGNQVKIIDFGIASFITVFGKNFQLYGTEGYAAPEALNGDTVTTASDIYSLGKVLEALARACTPDCSETLTHIIEKAADRNPDSRYQTATDLKIGRASCRERV